MFKGVYYFYLIFFYLQEEYLDTFKATSGHSTARAMIGAIMNNSVAMQFNMNGRKRKNTVAKRGFKSTCCWKLILSMYCHHFGYFK